MNNKALARLYYVSACLLLLLIDVTAALASVGPPPPSPDVPIDGGLSLFIGASAVFAFRKLRKGK